MGAKEDFERAVRESKELSQKPDNETLLSLYSFYKQATEGDIQIDPPENPFDFVGKAKYDAWTRLKGMSAEEAMLKYTELVNNLK